MRTFTFIALMAFIVFACAVPITPAAPTLQRRAEQFRLQGLKEHEIAAKLAPSETDASEEPEIKEITLSERLSSLLEHCDDEDEDDDDHSGDIPPGSLTAPEMLPHAANSDDNMITKILAALRREDLRKDYAYEGHESELRRPTGMRHWGAVDKWRVF
ncbi:hypothetical protein P280DRAFT_413417 [Massarina eburnea CBS 473.64]|uniref:Uncharacterized protein n=1 Tax=Massarina eburnea CBS 473.64 TaxID=1395130 RepID=A0A6A6RHK9_9PLEO|nr:hypothetical protein P280DRAFT_413417 [Massarina eburnea CBS 473.64]